MKHLKSSPLETMVHFLVIAMAITMASSDQKPDGKITGKIDIVIIVPRYNDYDALRLQYKEALRKHLFDHIQMGGDTRVAMIDQDPNEKPIVIFSLTNDQQVAETAMEAWDPTGGSSRDDQAGKYRKAKELFDLDNAERAKVVIMFKSFYARNSYDGIAEAKRLRDIGIFIYVFATFTTFNLDARLIGDAIDQTGSSTRVFKMPNDAFESVNNIGKLKSIIERDLCSYCRLEGDKCVYVVHQPGIKPDYFGDNNARCPLVPHSTPKVPYGGLAGRCPKNECELEVYKPR